MSNVVVSGSFDDLRSPHIRFLEEAAKRGDLHVQLWSDDLFQSREGRKAEVFRNRNGSISWRRFATFNRLRLFQL